MRVRSRDQNGRGGAARSGDYAPETTPIPYEDTAPLIERGLIKVIYGAQAQTVVQVAADEAAATEIPEPAEEPAAVPEEETEEPIEETEVEELSAQELDDVQSYEEEEEDEDGIEVVGVMLRRRGKKVYRFDPDGKTWEKGEIALYKTPGDPPQEVIVVDNAKLSPNKLHLPLKPLCKAPRRPSAVPASF